MALIHDFSNEVGSGNARQEVEVLRNYVSPTATRRRDRGKCNFVAVRLFNERKQTAFLRAIEFISPVPEVVALRMTNNVYWRSARVSRAFR